MLDDDPTGTQCAAGVEVLLRPAAVGPLPPGSACVYVLTNTRALTRDAAFALVAGLRDRIGPGHHLVLRGDSTLRGHVFAEMGALGLRRGVGLIVPAYPAAGRVTVGGVHYLTAGGAAVNVADTEFARDPVFGFTARTMTDWVHELGGRRPVTLVRRGGPLRAALLETPDGGVVIPDVECDADLAPIVAGLAAARAAGRHVVVRCAAPLAARIGGVPGRLVRPSTRAERLLVVCGSHTAAATAQLDALGLPRLELPTDGAGAPAPAIVAQARQRLAATGIAVVTTERRRRAEHGSLADGAAVMAGLMAVTRAVAPAVDAVISKGGITSAEVATTGLGGAVATVRGQLETGIPLWEVGGVPLAVVPGNIGDAGTLARMVGYFSAR
ncbi:hypothetical protein Dvina_38210 [Dactylosporangium vinaceum]|uniref:Four-carbon acid sugar kinase family protein n=1 Tax=Dactylosporangium vinaceum TaxID=53362 RepID=A0ABV5MKY4_9ACTN|nr:four-carbon acid sugar kinase family protein [Dactylosporangium vinaceum]UAB93987.1 hypothetical protein Dvina_38210 [Dactylosporangium vinaceum]